MSGKNILIVDDEQLILKSLETNLQREQFCVFTATSVEQALTTAKKHPCDIILCDYCLGHKTGIDLFEQIKQISPDCKFILISGNGDKLLVDKVLSQGVDLFIAKPFNLDEILEAIKNL
jgi:DNA-binding NtrC family response regulator